MKIALITFVMGTALGYLAQRSRICFIGGLRDFVLVRDTALLKGAIAFFVTAWLAFSVAGALHLVDWATPAFDGQSAAAPAQAAGGLSGLGLPVVIVTVVAGVALGLFSTLANGCPTRQHVLAAQGLRDSMFYLGGFYLGVVVYFLVTRPLLARVF